MAHEHERNIILFCYAHPDDESFGPGGTIAMYADRPDTEVHLLCATRGEEGQLGTPPLCMRAELGRVREQELREAAAILGITEVHFWPYRDKLLSRVARKQLALDVQTLIYKLNPHVVVTFARHGITGHPDHTAIHHAVHTAVLNDPRTPVRKLYDQTYPASIAAARGLPHGDPDESITTTISVERYVPKVIAALKAHRTQHAVVEKAFPGFHAGEADDIFSLNYYMLRWSAADASDAVKETDLLACL